MIRPDGVILSCLGLELSREEKSFFKSTNPFGFVLFKRNFKTREQLIELINQLRNATKNKQILIFIDQEGGKVQRLVGNSFSKFQSQKFFGDIYLKDKIEALDLAYKSSFLLGTELNSVRINANFSPVCDLLLSGAHNVIGSRSFSSNPSIVYELSRAFCEGMKDSGVYPVLKHFPGHGRSKFDTHLNKSVIDSSYDELSENDLVPFKLLNNETMVMLAHIIYKSIDSKVATFSEKIIKEILRKKLLFKGIVISDDLSMKALEGSLNAKVKKAYSGGCDVVLYCHGLLKEMIEIYPHVTQIDRSRYNYFISELPQKKKSDTFEIKKELIKRGVISI